ncbi:MAG: DUF3696 domain-containing protein [Cuspidothrix sp.]
MKTLHKKRDDLINEKLCLGEDAKTLATQTEEWPEGFFDQMDKDFERLFGM